MRSQVAGKTQQRTFVHSTVPEAKSMLTKLAAWTNDLNLPFRVISIGMIVMLLWAGAYKMTAPGAEGIIPLVSNSPLIWWHFKLFGPYIGSDIIGLTEITAALLMIAGHFQPKAGIVGGFIGTLMFFITSTMVISTPGATVPVHGIRYMSFLGLFLFKDVISLWSMFLPGQLFRPQSHPSREQERIIGAGEILGKLRGLDGLSIKETAHLLGVPSGILKAQLAWGCARVKQILRKSLQGKCDAISHTAADRDSIKERLYRRHRTPLIYKRLEFMCKYRSAVRPDAEQNVHLKHCASETFFMQRNLTSWVH